ncbi:MAG: DeoR/GlpR transcriptional regulator [Lachnospiraceae bacterium]|nr:DeoR/GlpR transcriptional regulator [Lachnospiraceae bacterium]MCI8994362.1 DeoR/GlpR transcriptional regulator [Lachnospiraceae bacterium]MCI9132937.1 DeoR/GlpR transcriptional regulator [Lachnospiraceae bacterium]
MAVMGKQTERMNWILQKLEMWGAVSVSDLSTELNTSVVTIRKDLKLLEEQGKLSRVAGGAVSCRKQREPEAAMEQVSGDINRELKHAVAKKASQFIEDGDSLIITCGVTPHLTALYAEKRRNLKIVTDSLIIAEDLCRRPDYQVIILGGEIYTKESFVHGRDAVCQANRYMADKAIVTMDGVDAAAGLTTLRVEGADTLKSILARARMRILVADVTKIGLESFCHVGGINDADILVTNRTEDEEKLAILGRIAAAGVTIEYAE